MGKLKQLADKRYTVTKEFCGYEDKRFIVRFCKDFISAHNTSEDALKACIEHDADRIKEFNR